MNIDKAELANFIASTVACEALDFEEALKDAFDCNLEDEYHGSDFYSANEALHDAVSDALQDMMDSPESYISMPIYTADIRKIWEENESSIDDFIEPWMIGDCKTIGDMISNSVQWWLLDDLQGAARIAQSDLDLTEFGNPVCTVSHYYERDGIKTSDMKLENYDGGINFAIEEYTEFLEEYPGGIGEVYVAEVSEGHYMLERELEDGSASIIIEITD